MHKSTPECREGCEVYENWLKSGDVITGLEQKIETLLEENRQRAALELDATGTIKALRAEVSSHKAALDLIAGEGHTK